MGSEGGKSRSVSPVYLLTSLRFVENAQYLDSLAKNDDYDIDSASSRPSNLWINFLVKLKQNRAATSLDI